MKIGFITNSLSDLYINDIETIADWAYENNFKGLEIGPSVEINENKFEKVLQDGKVELTAFIYCRNFLSNNTEEAEIFKNALLERIKAAKKFNIKNVICSTGITEDSFDLGNIANFHPEKSLDKVAELFKFFADEAEKNNVRLCFENCPLMGNIAISPYMWEMLFEKIGSDKVGLVYDPSHLVWQLIEPYKLIMEFKDRIFHVHGKDCQVDFDKLKRYGILQSFSSQKSAISTPHGDTENLWWRYRLPGLGDLDWSKIISNLYEINYDGFINIEHEDPVFGGTEEKVKDGLIRSMKHISSFL